MDAPLTETRDAMTVFTGYLTFIYSHETLSGYV